MTGHACCLVPPSRSPLRPQVSARRDRLKAVVAMAEVVGEQETRTDGGSAAAAAAAAPAASTEPELFYTPASAELVAMRAFLAQYSFPRYAASLPFVYNGNPGCTSMVCTTPKLGVPEFCCLHGPWCARKGPPLASLVRPSPFY